MKKLVFIFIAIGLAVLYFFKGVPLVEKNLLSKIQQVSQENQWGLNWEDLKVQPLRLQVVFQNIKTPYLNSTVPKLIVQIAPLRSLWNQRFLFNLKIKNLQEDIHWDSNEGSFFKTLTTLPISKIKVQKSYLKVYISENYFIFKNVQLHVQNHFQILRFRLQTQTQALDSAFEIKTRAWLKEDKINFNDFRVQSKDSKVFLSGHSSLSKELEDFSIAINGFFSSKDFKNVAHILNVHTFDEFSGFFNIQSQLHYTEIDKLSGNLQVEITDFSWKDIFISKIKAQGNLIRNILQVEMAHFEREDDWTVFSDSVQVFLDENFSFSFQSFNYIKNFTSFQDIFNLKTGITFNGPLNAACKGQLKVFSIECSLDGQANHLKHSLETENISFLTPFNFKGDLTWMDLEKTLKLNFKSNQSEFESHLQLNSEIQTSTFTGQFDLSEVEHIAQLKVQGELQIHKGVLSFPNNQMLMQAQLRTQNLTLNEYVLGNLSSSAILNENFILFDHVQGQLNHSFYSGKVRVLFSEDPRIQMQTQFKPIFLEDFKEFLSQNLTLPFDISGQGFGTLTMDSPLDWNRIQYQIKSQFKDFYIKNEFFQSGNIHIVAQDGLAHFQNTKLKKIRGDIIFTGTLKNAQNLNIQITGKELILERISNIKKWLHPNLSGIFDFNLKITNYLQDPYLHLQGSIKNLNYFSSPLGEGVFNFKYASSQFDGNAEFFNKKFILEKWSGSLKHPYSSIKIKTHKFDFMPFIVNSLSSMSSQVSGQASLQFNSKELISGFLNIEDISLMQNKDYLKSTQPLYFQFKNQQFTFRGSSLQFQTNTNPLSIRKVNPHESLVIGDINSSFLTLLFPYVDYAHGILDVHVSLNNHLKNWNPRGGIQMKKGSVKVGDVLDSFQDVEFEGVLNSNKLELKKFTAQTLTGNLSGSGTIQYSKNSHFPIDIKGTFNQLGLNLSQNTRIQGSGSYLLFGKQIPYTLKGNFNLIDGYSRQNFEENEDSQDLNIEEEKSSWFNLDILAFFENPFLIENSFLTTSLRGSLHLTGPYFSPTASGNLEFLPGGFFNIKEYEFEISQGNVSYTRNSIFNPYFDIVGKTTFEEVLYTNEREVLNNYEITAQIYGHADAFKLNFSSDPYLSENNILSMMALGAKSVGFSGQAPLSSYLQIASVIFQDAVGRKLENTLGFRLSIVPYMNSNRPTRVKARKRWSNNLVTSVSSSISSIEEIDRSLQIEYSLTPRLSLLGTWKEAPYTLRQTNPNNQEEYNFEIEYKIDF